MALIANAYVDGYLTETEIPRWTVRYINRLSRHIRDINHDVRITIHGKRRSSDYSGNGEFTPQH